MNAVADEIKSNDTSEVEVAVEQPKAKHKTKTKSDDLLVQIVQEIGTLNSTDALEAVPSLLNSADENYFRLGGVLSIIQSQKFYEAEGFDNFKSFIEGKYGIQYRKAMYWIKIYVTLIESSVSWGKVKDVGWTKLKDLAEILTPENVDEWVEKALSLTVLQLQEAIKAAKSGSLKTSGLEPVDDHKSQVTTFTVKVHQDQKLVIREAIDKAKKDAGTEYDGVALEGICANYLNGGNVTAKSISVNEFVKKFSAEEILNAVEKHNPELVITVKIPTK